MKSKLPEKIVNSRNIQFFRSKANRKRGEGYFLHAEVCRSNGALKNIKFQAPNLRVSGVRCRVSGKRNLEAETSVFEIYDLEFLFLQHSKTARNLYWQSHSTLTPARRDRGLALHIRPILSGTQLLAIWPGFSCGCLNPELLPRRDSLLGKIGNGPIKSFLQLCHSAQQSAA